MENKTLAQRIKLIRQDLGYTMEEFGKLFNANKSMVSKWEKGATKPSPERLKKLSEIVGTNVLSLIYDSPEEFLYYSFNEKPPIKSKEYLTKEGLYYIYFSVLENYALDHNIKDFKNYDFFDEDSIELIKSVKNNAKIVVMAKINILKTMLRVMSKIDDETLEKTLPSRLANIIIENKSNIDNIDDSEIINNGFIIESIEPYDFYKSKEDLSIFKKSDDLMQMYSKMCERICENNFDVDEEISNTFLIQDLAKDILDEFNETQNSDFIYEPIFNFSNDIFNHKIKELRLYFQKIKDEQQ